MLTEDEIYEIVHNEVFDAGFGGLVVDRAVNKIVRRLLALQEQKRRPWWRCGR